jgi:hypothetical protein
VTAPSSTAPSHNDVLSGTVAAVVGAVLGAAAWAVLVSVTDYKIGFAAVGVGALTGYLAGRSGGGATQLPVIAAVVGLLGCVLGDLLADAHQVSRVVSENGGSVSMLTVFKDMVLHPGVGWDVYRAGFGALDLLFYAFAAQTAFQLARPRVPLAPPEATAPWAEPASPAVDTAPAEPKTD